MISRRAFLEGLGVAAGGGVPATRRSKRREGVTVHRVDVEKGVLRVALSGVEEGDVLRYCFRACGQTWAFEREVRTDGAGGFDGLRYLHVEDIERAGPADPGLWRQARLTDVTKVGEIVQR